MAIINGQQAVDIANLIDQPQQAERTFWTAKAFHGYIGETYQIECSYETVVRFFHKQGYALKTPKPWPDKQDEQLRETFLDEANKTVTFQRTTNILIMDNASIQKGLKEPPISERYSDKRSKCLETSFWNRT